MEWQYCLGESSRSWQQCSREFRKEWQHLHEENSKDFSRNWQHSCNTGQCRSDESFSLQWPQCLCRRRCLSAELDLTYISATELNLTYISDYLVDNYSNFNSCDFINDITNGHCEFCTRRFLCLVYTHCCSEIHSECKRCRSSCSRKRLKLASAPEISKCRRKRNNLNIPKYQNRSINCDQRESFEIWKWQQLQILSNVCNLYKSQLDWQCSHEKLKVCNFSIDKTMSNVDYCNSLWNVVCQHILLYLTKYTCVVVSLFCIILCNLYRNIFICTSLFYNIFFFNVHCQSKCCLKQIPATAELNCGVSDTIATQKRCINLKPCTRLATNCDFAIETSGTDAAWISSSRTQYRDSKLFCMETENYVTFNAANALFQSGSCCTCSSVYSSFPRYLTFYFSACLLPAALSNIYHIHISVVQLYLQLLVLLTLSNSVTVSLVAS